MSILKTLTINGTRYNVTPVVPTDAVTLYASAWEGNGDVYSQVVNVPGVTPKTKVDLQPTSEQLVDFHDKILAFVAENDGGTVTVYSIADKPTGDHTIQITKTEVAGTGKIRGNTVGTTMPSVLYTEQHLTPEQKAVARKNIGSGAVVCLTAEEAEEAPDGSLWVVHPTESTPKGISLYYAGENEADLKNAPNGSVCLAPKSSNKPATPEGGITEETDPTVPDWAKQPQKPTYTAAEVGAATPDDITKALANLPAGGELEGFEMIDTIDFSTEEMSKPGAGKVYEVDNVTEVIFVYQNMTNISESTNSYLPLFLNGFSCGEGAASTGPSKSPKNGFFHYQVLKNCGTKLIKSQYAASAVNYNTGTGYLSYNLMPITEPITNIGTGNSPNPSWYAASGIMKIYVR